MRRGLDWYKREPRAIIDAKRAARMTTRQAAIYDMVLDLIYEGGGVTPNDAKYIASHFSDIGSAAARRTIQELIDMGKLMVEGTFLTQERAKNEAKTRQNLSETRAKTGRIGGVSSGVSRAKALENNDMPEANASSKYEAEKRREEKKDPLKPPKGGDEFDEWYSFFPRKVAKGAARRAFAKARKIATQEQLMDGVKKYVVRVAGKDEDYISSPSKWLSGHRWLDEDKEKIEIGDAPTLERRVEVARDWLSRNNDIPPWMDRRDTADALLQGGYDYDMLRSAGFSLPPRGNVAHIHTAPA